MSDTIFAFSQRGGYHFETTSKWHYGRLPDELSKLFNSNTSLGIASCYHAALGANESFFVSYKSRGGPDRIYGVGLPDQLGAFLNEKNSSTGALARNIPGIRIALGPYNKSWWASDGSSFRWMNLPKGLEDALKAKRSNGGTGPFTDAPRLIALGTDGDYFMVTEGNAANWCLADYRELQTIVKGCKDTEAGVSNIKSLVLHPYRLQTWVLQTTSGLVVGSNLPPHMEEHFDSIKAAVQEDTSARTALLAGFEREMALQADYRRRRAAEQVVAMKLGQTINVMAAVTLGLIMGSSSGLNEH